MATSQKSILVQSAKNSSSNASPDTATNLYNVLNIFVSLEFR